MSSQVFTNLHTDAPLRIGLEARLEQSRPRLLRLARAFRIPSDAVDDIAQETVIRGWQQLEQLRSAERFDAWLDAICRRQCQMYLRRSRVEERYRTGDAPDWERHNADPGRLTDAPGGSARFEGELAWLADTLAVDPLDALEQSEMAQLLDRAMGYVAPQARVALELRYLHGLSTAEAAEALHVNAQALDMRLYRARARLREALAGPLRHEADALDFVGSAVYTTSSTEADEVEEDWQATQIICYLCGRQRLLGRFEQSMGERRELRLRCPGCSRQHGVDVFRSKGIASLENLRAFRPALTRAMRAIEERGRRSLATGSDICLHCGNPVQRQLVMPEAFPVALPQTLQMHWLVAPCGQRGCAALGAWPAVAATLWFDPVARQFMANHHHWTLLPEEAVNWQGRPAIRCGLADNGGSARLTLFVDSLTLRSLAHY